MDTYVLLKNGSVVYEGENDPRASAVAKPAAAPSIPFLAQSDASPGAAAATDSPTTDPLAGAVYVTLAKVDSVGELGFTIPEAGNYWVQTGEQYDQTYDVVQGGATVATYPQGFQETSPIALVAGPGVLRCSLRAGAVTDEVLAKRVADGQGVSSAHYQLRKAGTFRR